MYKFDIVWVYFHTSFGGTWGRCFHTQELKREKKSYELLVGGQLQVKNGGSVPYHGVLPLYNFADNEGSHRVYYYANFDKGICQNILDANGKELRAGC